MTESYNGLKWISHLYCDFTKFHTALRHALKSFASTFLSDAVNMIEKQWDKESAVH